MVIITQNLISDYISSISFSHIRHILHKQRLRLDKPTIAFYLYCLYLHNHKQKTFAYIHKYYFLPKYATKYSTFMHNINHFSLFLPHFFKYINKTYHIDISNTTIVDTTLIEEKKETFIVQKDWNKKRVTIRDKRKICGSKGLIFINMKKQVVYANLLNINDSDQNILKDSAIYQAYLSQYLLADRGFNSNNSKQRVKSCGSLLITPNHYKVVQKTKQYFNELWYSKLYKKRWKIETLFKKLKDNYADFKLNLTGKYTKTLKKAKFLLTIIAYNLSTMN